MIAPKCENCGSYSIRVEAILSWDMESQDWEVVEHSGYSYCGKCNEDANFTMVETTEKGYADNIADD